MLHGRVAAGGVVSFRTAVRACSGAPLGKFSLPSTFDAQSYIELPWSGCGKPKAFLKQPRKDYKAFSWVKGVSAEPLIEDPIGKWFETQVVGGKMGKISFNVSC